MSTLQTYIAVDRNRICERIETENSNLESSSYGEEEEPSEVVVIGTWRLSMPVHIIPTSLKGVNWMSPGLCLTLRLWPTVFLVWTGGGGGGDGEYFQDYTTEAHPMDVWECQGLHRIKTRHRYQPKENKLISLIPRTYSGWGPNFPKMLLLHSQGT